MNTVCVCSFYAFVYVHALTLSVSAASAPCNRSFATVPASPFAQAKCNADQRNRMAMDPVWQSVEPACREARTRTRQCHAPLSSSLAPLSPSAVCATCRSRTLASLVVSISSAAAASWLLPTASIRAVVPSCMM